MDKTTLLFASLTLASFAAIVAVAASVALRRLTGKRGDAVVFLLPINRKEELKAVQLLESVDFPIAFDVVVQHLGSDREVFAVAGRKDANKAEKLMKSIWPEAAIERSDDYLVFHHGGFYDVLRVMIPDDDFNENDIAAVDLSGVNEIGEGAVMRFFRDPKAKEKQISVLGLFSAPSQYQLRDIEDSVQRAFKGRKFYSPKNKEEIFRMFGSAEEIAR